MTRFSAYLIFLLSGSAVACGGTTYTTDDAQGTGGSTSTGGVVGSGGTVATGGTTGTGGAATGGSGTGSTTISASSFSQSCEWDSQCLPVFEGNVCGCNSCPNAAINSSDSSAYDAARAQISCPPTDLLCPAVDCQQMVGSCRAGKCAARPAVIISHETFGDQSCNDDSDCTMIYSGELCSECQCSFVPVNLNGKKQYDELVADAQCVRGPSACDCAEIPSTPFCDTSSGGGVCRIAQ